MKDSNTFVYVDNSGIVQETSDFAIGIANPLRFSPQNWDDTEQTWQRSDSMHGIFTKLSGEYIFCEDGAKILRYLSFSAMTGGYTAQGILRVDKRLNVAWIYSTYQECAISFEKPKYDMETVTVQLYEDGLAQRLKSNLDTPYEITIDGGEQIFFAGTRVLGSARFRYSGAMYIPTAIFGVAQGIWFNSLLPIVNEEGYAPVQDTQSVDAWTMGMQANLFFFGDTEYTKYAQLNKDTQPIAKTVTRTATQVRVNLVGTGTPTVKFEQAIAKGKAASNYTRYITYSDVPFVLTAGVPVTIDIPESVTDIGDVLSGEGVYILHGISQVSGSSGLTGYIQFEVLTPDTSDVEIISEFNTAGTNVNALRQPVMYDKAIKAMANGDFGVSPASSILLGDPTYRTVDNYPYHTWFCNALHLKGVNDAIFKVTIGDLLKHFQTLYPCGIGVKNNVVSLEDLSYFYDDTVVISDLGVLTDWEIIPTNEMGTVIKAGYKYDESDVLNGRDTFNSVNYYKSDARFSADKEIDLTSPAIADVQSTEKQRVQEYGKNTTGNKIDDELFVFETYRTHAPGTPPFLDYPNQTGGVVSGVTFPDWVYNVGLSIRRNLQRNIKLISSWCYPSTKEIKFQSTERNADLVSKFDAGGGSFYPEIAEKQSIIPSADAYWLPYKITFKAITGLDLPELMKINPYGVFTGRIIINGKFVNVRIFADSISFKPAKRNTYEIEGRLSPNNDLSSFI